MLDIVTRTPKAIENCKARGGDIWSTHHDIGDFSLYERFANFKKIPIEALTSKPDLTPSGEVIREIVTPQRMENFSALQNVATGNVIDVTPFKGSYTFKPHLEAMKEQAGVVERSPLPTGNVEVIDRIFDEGVRVHRTIYFHEMTHALGYTKNGEGDTVRCRLDIFNSVDKSWSLQVFSGAYRDLCRNTLVFGGEKAYHTKQKHTGTMSNEAANQKAVLGLEMWANQSEQMKLWRQAEMTNRQFADVIKPFCRKNTKGAELEDSISINERKFNYLLERFTEEKRELGGTMWAAYNALTHWATHLPDAYEKGRAEKKRFDRNNEVRQIITGPDWLYFEGLAGRKELAVQ